MLPFAVWRRGRAAIPPPTAGCSTRLRPSDRCWSGSSPGPRVAGLFPHATRFESHVEDALLEDAIFPAARASVRWLGWFRFLQQGRVQQYLLYMLLAVIALLLWSVPSFEYLIHLFSR